MQVDELLQREVRELMAMERGLLATLSGLEARVRHRKVAVTITMLLESSTRHLEEIERMCAEERWPVDADDCLASWAWETEVERRVLGAPPSEVADMDCLGLLRRAVHMKIPCYESARLLAFYAERPRMARTLRLAVEDERLSEERMACLHEHTIAMGAARSGMAPIER